MKRSTKIWLVVAIALVLIGIIIIEGALILIDFDFSKLATNRYETNEYVIDESFEGISIITDTADISFVISEQENPRIVCFEQSNVKHQVLVNDGTLSIECRDERRWYEYIGINWDSPTITVYLPKGQYGDLSVKTDTGAVEIPKDLKFGDIDISTDTGVVKVLSSAEGNVKVKTDTGLVKIDNISALSIDVTVSTGEVAIKNSKVSGDVSVTVDTGKAKVTNVKCQNFTSKGDTGDLTVVNTVAAQKIYVERDTGDVAIGTSDVQEIYIQTDTGDVWCKWLSPKIVVAHSDTGRISVPESAEGGRCEVRTDTGDIEIIIKSN